MQFSYNGTRFTIGSNTPRIGNLYYIVYIITYYKYMYLKIKLIRVIKIIYNIMSNHHLFTTLFITP